MGDIINGKSLKKADLILLKVEKLGQQVANIENYLSTLTGGDGDSLKKLIDANAQLEKDVHYLSAQSQAVYAGIAKLIKKLSDDVHAINIPATPTSVAEVTAAQIDYDELASKVADKLVMPRTEIDYDELASQIASKLIIATPQIDYDALGTKVVENMTIPNAIVEDLDTEDLAKKISSLIPAPEVVSPDYIASKVAEQIVIPDNKQESVDVDELSGAIAEKIVIPTPCADVSIDEEAIAQAIAERLSENAPVKTVVEQSAQTIDEQALADKVSEAVIESVNNAIDGQEIADYVVKHVGNMSPDQFDVMVDDSGCDTLAKQLEEKFDYDELATKVAERLNAARYDDDGEIDTEELAKTLSEKLSVTATVNEDAIADKAAAILSNYLPEVDSDEIAEKVVSGVVPAIPAPAAIDYDRLVNSITEKMEENQEDKDFDIVIDDEGVNSITQNISQSLDDKYAERISQLEGEVDSLKQAIESGSITQKVEGEVSKVREQVEEVKNLLLSGAIVAAASQTAATTVCTEYGVDDEEEELVKVSDIVTEDTTYVEAKDEQEEDDDDGVIDEIVDDLDENVSDGEVMPDGIPGISGGVDFSNMMKYNRSFIARIIQGSDDQKNYYGEIKNALLSYKKVNSNIAWGAERFNKGRDTIARFKIRGKTLCLYLALNPADYKTSVYHHADVSDNKSMKGTPMMVKIKSPLGVKKAVRLIDEMLQARGVEKKNVEPRNYAAMYPYEDIDELIEDGLVKDVSKK